MNRRQKNKVDKHQETLNERLGRKLGRVPDEHSKEKGSMNLSSDRGEANVDRTGSFPETPFERG